MSINPPRNPYVGPRAFDEDEKPFFFGRDREIEILAGLVMARRASLFFAQSGAGKSSLLRAGLLPYLTKEEQVGRGRRQRTVQKMRVLPVLTVGGGIPAEVSATIANLFVFSALLRLLPDAAPNDLSAVSLTQALADFFATETAAVSVLNVGDEPTAPPSPSYAPAPMPDTLLIFDQFEEIFTYHPTRGRERADFFAQVADALASYPTLHVLFTMREDFIAELTPYTHLLPEELRPRFRLERLQSEAALQAVKQPALGAGRSFAPEVAEELVDNLRRSQVKQSRSAIPTEGNGHQAPLGEYVEPVHLQIVCRQLWDSLPPEQTEIRREDVQVFGDVDQALIGFYESTLRKAIAIGDLSERRLRTWFDDHLITPARTRGLVYRGDEATEGLPNEAVDILNNAYIIRADIRGSDTWYELAHDRLVEPILTANALWLSQYRNPLMEATAQWLAADRSPLKLLSGRRLEEAQAFADRYPQDVLPKERDFLEQSERADADQKAAAATEATRRRQVRLLSIFFMLMLMGLTTWALYNGFVAQEERAKAVKNASLASAAQQTAEANEITALQAKATAVAEAQRAQLGFARQVSSQAQGLMAEDPAQGTLLALEAFRLLESVDGARIPELEEVLRTGLGSLGGRGIDLAGYRVTNSALSHSGRWLAVFVHDDLLFRPTVYLWDLDNPHQARPILLDVGPLTRYWSHAGPLVFFEDRWLVTSSSEKLLRWDLSAPNPATTALDLGSDMAIQSLSASQDGRWLLAVGASRAEEDLGVSSVAVWDLASPTPGDAKQRYLAPDVNLNQAFLSNDGRRLVAVGNIDDRGRYTAVRVWLRQDEDAAPHGGAPQDPLPPGATHSFRSLLVSSDAVWLITLDDENGIAQWDLRQPYPLQESVDVTALYDSGDELRLFISPDNRWGAAIPVNQDNSIGIWNLQATQPGWTSKYMRDFHLSPNPLLSFSADGRWLAVSTLEGIELQNLTGNSTSSDLQVGFDVNGLTFSPDSRWLVVSSRAGDFALWDVTERIQSTSEPLLLPGHSPSLGNNVNGPPMIFSADGSRLLTQSTGSVLRIWDAHHLSPSADPIVYRSALAIPGLAMPNNAAWAAVADRDAHLTVQTRLTTPGTSPADDQFLPGAPQAAHADGTALLTSETQDLRTVWNLEDDDPQHHPLHLPDVAAEDSVMVTADGRWAITYSPGISSTLTAWDLTQDPTRSFSLAQSDIVVRSVEASPDSRWLFSHHGNDTLLIWDLTLPDPGQTALTVRTSRMQITPDGRWLVLVKYTPEHGDEMILWPLHLGRLDAPFQALTVAGKRIYNHNVRGSRWITGYIYGEDDNGEDDSGEDDSGEDDVVLFDLAQPEPSADPIVLRTPGVSPYGVEFSKDLRWLAITGNTPDGEVEIAVWDLDKPLSPPRRFAYPNTAASVWARFSPNSRWLVAEEYGGGIQQRNIFWNLLDTDLSEPTLDFSYTQVTLLPYTEQSTWLATYASSDETLQFWRVDAESSVPLSRTVDADMSYPQVWGNGRWLTARDVESRQLHLWDLTSVDPISASYRLNETGDDISVADGTGDGGWLVTRAADSQEISLWSLSAVSGPSLTPTLSFRNPIQDADLYLEYRLDPQSNWIAFYAGTMPTITLFTLGTQSPISYTLVAPGAISYVDSTADGRWLIARSTAGNRSLYWDLHAEAIAESGWQTDARSTSGATGASTSHVSSHGVNTYLHLWKIEDRPRLQETVPISGAVSAIAGIGGQPDRLWAVGWQAERLILWPLHQATPEPAPLTLPESQSLVRLSATGRWLVTDDEEEAVFLWDLMQNQQPQASLVLTGHLGQVNDVVFAPGERWLVIQVGEAKSTGPGRGFEDTTLYLWDLSVATPHLYTSTVHSAAVQTVAFSADGRWMATGSPSAHNLTDLPDRTVYLWDLHAQDPLANPIPLYGQTSGTLTLDFRADGNMLLSISASTAHLWDLSTDPPSLSRKFPLDTHWQYGTWSKDGRFLITYAWPRGITRWDLSTDPPGRLRLAQEPGYQTDTVQFTPDNAYLIALSHGQQSRWRHKIEFWRMDLATVKALACPQVGQNLAWSEWAKIFGDEPYRLTCPALAPHGTYVALGAEYLSNGNVDTARSYYQSLARLAPYFHNQPDAELARQQAILLWEEADLLMRGKQVDEALSAIAQAESLAPTYSPPEYALSPICQYGFLAGSAEQVLDLCYRVAWLSPSTLEYRDNYGIALALTGNTEKALTEFRFVVDQMDQQRGWLDGGDTTVRQQWIEALANGDNPFADPKILEYLLEEHKRRARG